MILQQKKTKYKKMQKGKLTNFQLKSQKKKFSTGGTMLAIKTASIL